MKIRHALREVAIFFDLVQTPQGQSVRTIRRNEKRWRNMKRAEDTFGPDDVDGYA